MLLLRVLGGRFSILSLDTLVRLAIGFIAAFGVVIINILSTLKDTSELDSKREFVSNVLLQKIGPVVGDVFKSYNEYKSRNEEDEPPDGPEGGFIEDPLGEFEKKSIHLTDKLREWTDWKALLEKSEDYMMKNLYLTILGLVLIIVSFVFKTFDENLILPDVIVLGSGVLLVFSFIPVIYRARVIRNINKIWRGIKDSVGGAAN